MDLSNKQRMKAVRLADYRSTHSRQRINALTYIRHLMMMSDILIWCCSECAVRDKLTLAHGLWLVSNWWSRLLVSSHIPFVLLLAWDLLEECSCDIKFSLFTSGLRSPYYSRLRFHHKVFWTGPTVKLEPKNIDIAVRISSKSCIEA